jgi:hypothetical protein
MGEHRAADILESSATSKIIICRYIFLHTHIYSVPFPHYNPISINKFCKMPIETPLHASLRTELKKA